MTIKPATKRAPPDADGKNESPNSGGNDSSSSHGQQNVVVGRSGVAPAHRNAVVMDGHGQSPQRRELYEDHTRHRCSPNKSSRTKRRDHMHDSHHKRERTDRVDAHKHPNVANSSPAGQRSHGVSGLLLPSGSNLSLGSSGNVGGGVVPGRNSPVINDVAGSSNHAAHLVNGVGGGNGGSVGGVGVGGVGVGCANTPTNTQANTPVNSGTPSSASLDYLDSTTSSTSGGGSNILQIAATKALKSIEEKCSGYNSGDEYMPSKDKAVTAAEWKRRDEQFVHIMSEMGFEVRQVEEDGACLFRAISLQIYGDEDAHDIIRQHTMDYIYKNREYFSHFVTEDIDSYITRKRRKDSHGNHIEIQAMSEIYSRPVEVYCYKPKPINIFNSEQQRNGYAPLRLSYQRWSHYNAIIDPYNATVGIGLGIANLQPQLQTTDAMRMSEQLEIEQTMFEDKLKTTDWEATNDVIEEQVARESYLQWCRENVQKTRTVVSTRSATATITSAQADCNADNGLLCDDIASPSKYMKNDNNMNNNNNIVNINNNTSSNINNNNNNIGNNSSMNKSIMKGIDVCVASTSARKVHFLTNSTDSTDAGVSLLGTTSTESVMTKKHTATAYAKFQKEVAMSNYDSDDTEISSGSGNNSPLGALARAKKNKSRFNSKKRRHEKDSGALFALLNGSGNGNGNGGAIGNDDNVNDGESGDTAQPRVHKSPKRDNALEESIEERPCSSKCAQQNNEGQLGEPAPLGSFSSFYQDLIESSYTADGFGQLSEAEMLQRAIQMSTQDFIEDQKRKYLYGP